MLSSYESFSFDQFNHDQFKRSSKNGCVCREISTYSRSLFGWVFHRTNFFGRNEYLPSWVLWSPTPLTFFLLCFLIVIILLSRPRYPPHSLASAMENCRKFVASVADLTPWYSCSINHANTAKKCHNFPIEHYLVYLLFLFTRCPYLCTNRSKNDNSMWTRSQHERAFNHRSFN